MGGLSNRFEAAESLESLESRYNTRIDELEDTITQNLITIDCPIKHLFVKGMYLREIFLPEGCIATSKIHKTEHPFTISKGTVKIFLHTGEWQQVEAPYTGITKAGTRRVVIAVTDCIWTTYHAYKTIKGTENSLSEEEKQRIVDRIEHRIITKNKKKLTKGNQLWLG